MESTKAMRTGVLMIHLLVVSAVADSDAFLTSQEHFGLGSAMQYVVGFSPYFGYEGSLAVSGTIKVEGTGLLDSATQTLSWQLKGVDPDCANAPLDVKNSCGVHVHQGLSCFADAGGHYWNSTLIPDDPWLVIRYTAKRSWWGKYNAKARRVEVKTGLTNYDVLGRTMVVHDSTGARVACGMIIPKKLTVNAFTPYIGYEGSLKVSGYVGVKGDEVEDAGAQDMSWYLKGVDPECSKAPPAGVANACGIHIHQGTSCYVPAGGHYWNNSLFPNDPWSTVTYRTWWGYAHENREAVQTGLYDNEVNGHTLIVHDVTGARVACGMIVPRKEIVNAFVPYYSYTGSLAVSGTVLVEGQGVLADASQKLHWRLQDVDPNCTSGPGTASNSCGVHIHEGMDCISNAGGHYWNKTAHGTDPWATISYTAKKWWGKYYATDYHVNVITGLTNADTLGHTLIVHDFTGARVACGILNIAS